MGYIIVLLGFIASIFFVVKLLIAIIKKQPKKQISKMLGISILAFFIGFFLTPTDYIKVELEGQIAELQEDNQTLNQQIVELQENNQSLFQENSEL